MINDALMGDAPDRRLWFMDDADGVMLYEHKLARRHTKEMADALGALDAGDKNAERRFNVAAHEYIELLTNHIHKEDNVLFDMGDRVMSDDDQTTLCKRFCEVGCRPWVARSARSWYR